MSFAPPDPQSAAPLPPPENPVVLDDARVGAAGPVRNGDVTFSWRVVLGLAWVLAFFAYAAVWQASVQIGIGTWWLGPRAQPTDVYVRLIPFVLPLLISLLLVYDVPRPVWFSTAAALASALIAVPDFGRTASLGTVELVIAALLLLVSVAATTGRVRSRPPG